MNQTSKKRDISLPAGSVITGKWHRNRYKIIKSIGRGAIGTVYLCESEGKYAALKISEKGSSVTMEVNVLKTFEKVQGSRLGPSLLDVDDWVTPNGERYSFYVMEYLKGMELSTFIRKKGEEWLGILILQLLDDLEELHQAGWVFGDLKTDNLLVTHPKARLRWIDVGGTTQMGRSIKEYTEFYDRGYWNMGSRRAEPSYDLFAVVMVMLHLYHPKQFEKGSSPKKTLMSRLTNTPQLKQYQPCLTKALTGEYTTSRQMKQELAAVLMQQPSNRARDGKKVNKQKPTRTSNRKQNNKRGVYLESLGIVITVLLFYLFYLVLI